MKGLVTLFTIIFGIAFQAFGQAKMMSTKVFFIVFLFILTNCANKHSDMEICFENIQNRIKSDSILKELAYSPIDCYDDFGSMLYKAVNEERESNSICSKAINEFLLENNANKNSITVNNLILFQQFQAYLKHKRFNYSKALDNALKYEAKRK